MFSAPARRRSSLELKAQKDMRGPVVQAGSNHQQSQPLEGRTGSDTPPRSGTSPAGQAPGLLGGLKFLKIQRSVAHASEPVPDAYRVQ